jgi:hypothetical protein
MDLLISVARSHAPSTQSWFEGAREHAQQATPDAYTTEVRKFLNAPSQREP